MDQRNDHVLLHRSCSLGNLDQTESVDQFAKVAGLVMDNDFGLVYELGFEAYAEGNPDIVSEYLPVRHDQLHQPSPMRSPLSPPSPLTSLSQ